MGTITITFDNDTEQRFREAAKKKLGERKGYLGKATTEGPGRLNFDWCSFIQTLRKMEELPKTFLKERELNTVVSLFSFLWLFFLFFPKITNS